MNYIFIICITVVCICNAVQDQSFGVGGTLARRALNVILHSKKTIPAPKAFAVDMEMANSLRDGTRKPADIPNDFNCLMPWTSMMIALRLSQTALTAYHDRDTVVQTYFGPRLREGKDFVKDRAALFEVLHNQPQIAHVIKQKQKEATS